MIPSFTHPQTILGLYDFFLSAKHNLSDIKNVLSLPSFIMGVNNNLNFKAQKSASIHHKSNPYGSRVLIKAF